jgi:two-component system sensor histidine kinase HydH
MEAKRQGMRGVWAVIPPWLIIGAVVILVPVFIFMTLENINRQKEQTTRLLLEKGAALIRSFEAGARTGIGLNWSGFQLQKLLMETAEEPDIDYLLVTDTEGKILADSDPLRIGAIYATDLNLGEILQTDRPAWRQVPNREGADTFEVYRRFSPTRDPLPSLPDPFAPRLPLAGPPPAAPASPPPGPAPHPAPGAGTEQTASPGWVIFVGLNMGPIEAAHREDIRHTIWMALVFLLLGCAGIISLLLAQGYRAARTSLSRIQAFSDSLVENMPIGLLATDAAGRVSAYNHAAEAILGQPAGAVLGRAAQEILPGECRELFRTLAAEGRLVEREIDCTVAGERTVPLEVIATPLRAEEAVAGQVVLFRDMTQIRRLEEEIARSRRLASLGSLAAGVAHEIRNPLSSLKGFATYFRERYRDTPADRETAEVMIREVDRLNRVISQLLEFARPLAMNRVPSSLPTVIRHAVKTVEKEARRQGIAIETDLDAANAAAPLPLDPDRMTQVFLNLFLNAIAAMEAGGMLRIALDRDEVQVRVTVSDTGSGIPREHLPRVFDPYFTTRSSGTGLGLAIVHKIVEAHGGEIRLESEPGRGTQAVVTLPLPPPGIPERIPGAEQRIPS